MNDSSEPETFAEEVSRQRSAASAEEDAELIKALETLKRIIERPTRAPRGINDVWGWSVGQEHAPQPGTETREEVLARIRKSYDPNAQSSYLRSEQELAALETIAAVVEGLKEHTGTSRHDLKRVVKALEAIIADKIGPGDVPTEGKGSKLLILPGDSTTGHDLAEQLAKPVNRPISKVKGDYIHIRSNDHPVIKSLVEKWGLTAVWVELQRMRRGMLESNPEIAAPLAQVAEEIDDLHESRTHQALPTNTEPSAAVVGDQKPIGTVPMDRKNQTSRELATGASPPEYTAVPNTQGMLLPEALRRVADEIAALQGHGVGDSPGTLHPHPSLPEQSLRIEKKEFRESYYKAEDEISVFSRKKAVIIKSKYLSLMYHTEDFDMGALPEAGKYYPVTEDYINFLRAADKIIEERKKLAEEGAEISQKGTISKIRLKWSDDKSGIRRMEMWQFNAWIKNMKTHLAEAPPVPDWDLLERLKDWNDWESVRPIPMREMGP